MGASQATPQTLSRQLQRQQARQIRPATTKERGDLLRSVGMANYRLRVKMRLRNNVASRKRILEIKLKRASQDDAATPLAEADQRDGMKPAIQSKDVKGLKYLKRPNGSGLFDDETALCTGDDASHSCSIS